MSDLKRTVLHDPDNDTLTVERLAFGVPNHRGISPEECVYLRTSEDGAYVNVGELLFAIEKATGVKPGAPVEPEPEPLWAEVRERPARAVKVTPELVQILATPGRPAELRELSPWFSPHTGNPAGVTFYDERDEEVRVRLGLTIILRHRHVPAVVNEADFEATYQEVAA